MVHLLRNSIVPRWTCRAKVAGTVVVVMLANLLVSHKLAAQSPVHYRYQGNEPPGAIGSWQLLRGGPLPGYFQPVEIRAPKGALVSLAVEGDFGPPIATPFRVGMLIAPVYRLRVTNIPLHEGEEVFPTIEVIDRLYPPAGQAPRFPIPIELSQEDLELALAGHFVMRVVYLEDANHALPAGPPCVEQNWFDAGPGANPVEVADRLGRPMAILRMGGRVPDKQSGAPDCQFLRGCPPFIPLKGSCETGNCGPEPVPVSDQTKPVAEVPPLKSKQPPSRVIRTVARPEKSRVSFLNSDVRNEPAQR